jgi:hypothetical protein
MCTGGTSQHFCVTVYIEQQISLTHVKGVLRDLRYCGFEPSSRLPPSLGEISWLFGATATCAMASRSLLAHLIDGGKTPPQLSHCPSQLLILCVE